MAAEKDQPTRPIKVREAAEMLGVAPRTIHNWIASGKIPGYIYGYNRFIVDQDDIEPLIPQGSPYTYRRIVPKGDES